MVVFEKAKPNFLSPGVSLERVSDGQSPTLFLIGDDDWVTAEHAAAMVGRSLALTAGLRLHEAPTLRRRSLLLLEECERI